MIKKIIFLILAGTNLMQAQVTKVTFNEECNASIEISTRVVEATPAEYAAVELTWNESNSFKNFDKVILEIQPLNDCMNDISGETLFDPIMYDILDLNKNQAAIKLGMLTTVNRKCFKWRILIGKSDASGKSCTTESNWNFTPFIF